VRFTQFLILVSLITVTTYSCRNNSGKNISQGEIHYSIEYAGDLGTLPMSLKPRSLVVSFKENKILFDIAAPIGNAGISNLSNPKIQAYETYLTLFGSQYLYSCKQGEIPPGFGSMDGMEIIKTPEISVICGFNCKKAEVTFSRDRSKKYYIWYTDEIKVKDPNFVTPFKDVDGVLMSFFYFLGKTELYFVAENVYKKDIPDETFERKEKFLPVSKEQMNSYILKMISF
jgi:hypothetical protein